MNMLVLVKNEVFKSVKNFRFIICLVIGLILNLIVLGQSYYIQISYSQAVNNFNNEFYNLECPTSVFNAFLLCNSDSQISIFFPYIIPLISAFYCGDSLYKDIKNKYMEQVLLRISKLKYLFSKFISTFINGFLICFFILVIGLMLSVCLFPSIKPQVSTGFFPLAFRNNILNSLYIESPYIYLWVFIVLNSTFSGLYALVSMAIFSVFNNYVIGVVFPFLMNLALSHFLCNMSFITFDINQIITPTLGYIGLNVKHCIVTAFILIIISVFLSVINMRENDEK